MLSRLALVSRLTKTRSSRTISPLSRFNSFHTSKALRADDHHGGKSPEYAILDSAQPVEFPVQKFTKYRRDGDDAVVNKSFSYFVVATAGMTYATAIKAGVTDLILTMAPSADVLAMANVEVDLSKIPEGSTSTVKWRGKPLFIRHRTAEEIEKAQAVDMSELKDPAKDQDRAKKAEWMVVLGICTHLGCVPLPGQGDYGGWFCPCHGSHYDTSGRIRKGPAPLNLEVPPYQFVEGEDKIIVGD